MNTLTIAEAQKIHVNFFGFEHTDHGILHLLKEAEETKIKADSKKVAKEVTEVAEVIAKPKRGRKPASQK